MSKYSLLLILVVIIGCECSSFDWSLSLGLNNFHWIIMVEAVRCSNETSLFRDKLIKILAFLRGLLSSKSRHSSIKCIHSPTHGIDEFRLIFIGKAINFICVLFDFFTRLNHFAVWLVRLKRLIFRSLSISVLLLVEPAKMNPLLILESFYFESVGHSLAQWSIIISMLSVFNLCGHLASFVAVFTIKRRFYK